MWFQKLTGCGEESAEQIRRQIHVNGDRMTFDANGRTVSCGTLETPTLDELRRRVAELPSPSGTLHVNEVVADVQELHADTKSAGALFQVASQFNLLEMVSPSVSPEDGIDGYEFDRTQGPACAVACGAGTIYRNYFADVDGQTGQTATRQIDCLRNVGDMLGNTHERLWTMKNGYAIASASGLAEISESLSQMSEAERDTLRSKLRIGIQWNTQVTLNSAEHQVTQTYCSALPVAYSRLSPTLWKDFASLVLEAAYEATFCAAALNSAATGNKKVFLTLLGGGAFGNDQEWILDAIYRALQLFAENDLNVSIVSYGRANDGVQQLIRRQKQA